MFPFSVQSDEKFHIEDANQHNIQNASKTKRYYSFKQELFSLPIYLLHNIYFKAHKGVNSLIPLSVTSKLTATITGWRACREWMNKE